MSFGGKAKRCRYSAPSTLWARSCLPLVATPSFSKCRSALAAAFSLSSNLIHALVMCLDISGNYKSFFFDLKASHRVYIQCENVDKTLF